MSERVCLIVDDEPSIRTFLTIIVMRKGFQSLEAENAVTALRMLQNLGGQVDLLITDIQMPGDMDGVDLAHSAKNSSATLPIILVSGNCDKVPTGFTFVRKPFTPEAVLEAIDKTLSQDKRDEPRAGRGPSSRSAGGAGD